MFPLQAFQLSHCPIRQIEVPQVNYIIRSIRMGNLTMILDAIGALFTLGLQA